MARQNKAVKRSSKKATKAATRLGKKSGATMWRRLNYFQSEIVPEIAKLQILTERMEAAEPLSAEYQAAAGSYLRRLLNLLAVKKALGFGRGAPSIRRGEDVALYLHVCKEIEGEGGYSAATQRTVDAWNLSESTIKEYDRDYGGLAAERLKDVMEAFRPGWTRAQILDALLLDIKDDHENDPNAEWRIKFLREKDLELQAYAGQVAQINRESIVDELLKIKALGSK